MPHLSRRHFLGSVTAALATSALPWPARAANINETLPRPLPSQLLWQRDELALFVHLTVNTYTGREIGLGNEDPKIFNPTHLDARQWARAAREGGAKAMILTTKHHDGFCLFPTATTKHSVESSPWRAGHGDVVREFADACRAENLRVGFYCSPWDRNSQVYGSDRYNDFYCEQLTEILTRYGEIQELWFDGHNGEGPNGKRQNYDWPRITGLVRKLQPNAVMFGYGEPGVRWCGNELGEAAYPNWSGIDRFGDNEPDWLEKLKHGNPAGTIWRPIECDTSIRPGWFYHASEDAEVKSVDKLMDIWFSSVGRNAKLLLNVPPDQQGLFHATDIARLKEFRAMREKRFGHDLAAGRKIQWRTTGQRTAVAEVDLGSAQPASIVRLQEDIAQGQRVAKYVLHASDGGDWKELMRGETIGCTKLDRFATRPLRRLRVEITDAIAPPLPLRIAVFG
jgi:alpha-L-fucosidase